MTTTTAIDGASAIGPLLRRVTGDEKHVATVLGPLLRRLTGDEKHVATVLGPLLRRVTGDEKHVATVLGPLLRRVTGDEKHAPSAHSTLDVIWVLYDRILRVSPATVDDPDRDRFLLSKGHGPAAYYAVLAAKGFIPPNWLDDLAGPDGRLGHHPDRLLVPGVEIGSGSLGHGLGLGVGTALGLRAQGLTGPRVYVLLGDAELDEGSNHEAIAYAGAVGLANLTAIVIDNRSSTHGWLGGIASRFAVNGWTAATVNGRDHDAIERGLRAHDTIRPHVVVAQVERKG